ncbi:MAG: porin, partial [Halopseudomonas sp.]
VYGRINMAVTWYNDQPSNINDLGIASYGSRLGFKGSEDLGGGLKGIWQLESSINPDEQNGALTGRNSFLGLAGGFGTVLVGNHDTPLKLVGRKVDLFGDTIGDSRNVMGGGSDTRAKNVVAYITPNLSGFSGAIAFSTDLLGNQVGTTTNVAFSTAGDAEDQNVWNLNAAYENGPIYVGVGYGDGDGHEAIGAGAHWRVAGAFTMGDFKFVGQYDSLEDENAVNPGGLAGDYDAWMIGAAFNMGAMTFKANYMDGEVDGVNGAEPEMWNLGVDYAMSKRTNVYAMYTGGEDVTLGLGAGSSDQVCGTASCGQFVNSGDISGLSFGVVHKF